MIAGKDAVRHGEAKNSWLTGTAAWNFVAISQHILGVRPELDGLRVDPCIGAEVAELHDRPQVPRRGVPDPRQEQGDGEARAARRRRQADRRHARALRPGRAPSSRSTARPDAHGRARARPWRMIRP